MDNVEEVGQTRKKQSIEKPREAKKRQFRPFDLCTTAAMPPLRACGWEGDGAVGVRGRSNLPRHRWRQI